MSNKTDTIFVSVIVLVTIALSVFMVVCIRSGGCC